MLEPEADGVTDERLLNVLVQGLQLEHCVRVPVVAHAHQAVAGVHVQEVVGLYVTQAYVAVPLKGFA